MNVKRKQGRPPTGKQTRDTPVRFFLTPEDAAWYAQFAHNLGFKSHSEFWAAIAERLLVGKLAPIVWLKLGYQIATRAQALGLTKGTGFYNPFESLPPLPVEDRPPLPPALPDEQLSASENKRLLSEVRKELQPR